MIGGLYGFYRDQLFYNLAQQTKTATLEDARGALDIMARDLKNAGSWATGAPPPETGAADNTIVLHADSAQPGKFVALDSRLQSNRAKLRERLHEVEATAPDPLPSAYAYVNTGEAAPASFVLRLGDPHSKLDQTTSRMARRIRRS
jgi:Tfp pilus assembly protein PilW